MRIREWSQLVVRSLAGRVGIRSHVDDGPSIRRRVPGTSEPDSDYFDAIELAAAMVRDSRATEIARTFNLDVLNVTWEDTARYKDSCVGPNISDVTIQVGATDPRTGRFQLTCMPVIRHPNFSDRSCDLDPHDITVLVGNERGQPLRTVSLYEILSDPREFLSRPDEGSIANRTLLAERDSKVLVSAQACFLPIPRSGKATFNPVLFNYQSTKNNPAVLAILATREGTSVTVIDNDRDPFESGAGWGQRLFHNQNGERASLTGTRYSDLTGSPSTDPTDDAISGANMVLLIQVPLKQKQNDRPMMPCYAVLACAAAPGSDVEDAAIGHGAVEGPFTELDDLTVERDPDFPVRVTVQFYKATSNGIVDESDLRQIQREIDDVYSQSDRVGSLVTQGSTGRATEYWGSKVQPPDWWERFWERYEASTGVNRDEAIRRLRQLLGDDFQSSPATDLYVRDLLR